MGPATALPPIPRYSTTKDKVSRLYYLAEDDPKAINDSFFNDVLHEVLYEYNDYLKELEHPVIGTVDFYGNIIQYSSEEELEYIKEFSERFDARTAQIFEYCHNNRGCCIPEVYNALTDIKNDELKRLNKHLKYKVDPNKVVCIKFL